IRRDHDVVGVSQHDNAVTVDTPGRHQLTARYVVGCDGAHSRVRELTGISFPGNSYPEVNRLGQVTVPDSVTRLDNGDLDVPGLGTIHAGFTRTDRGTFAVGSLSTGMLLVQTMEDESVEYDPDEPLTLAELGDSIRRVLGVELPLGEPIRLSRYQFQARQAQRYRDGRIMVAGDAAHQFPSTGIGLNAGMLDSVNLAWKLAAHIQGRAPAGLLDTYHDERHLANARALLHSQAQVALRRGTDPAADALREIFRELLADEQPVRRIAALIAGTDIRYPSPTSHDALTGTFAPDLVLHTDAGTTSVAALLRTPRPVFLDLADRSDLRAIAEEHHVDIQTAKTDDRPADALLIRPDAHIAWAAGADDHTTLRAALDRWFG
ncbi:MAG TPA: FAD-dependent monooxygenase, partial [Pseudonocardiaceae bacterium]|nr:FAD-dependent monooxygenase [Pseudonocardiaceae bacterium]